MAFDIKSILKDNWKLIASIFGLIIVVIMMSMDVNQPDVDTVTPGLNGNAGNNGGEPNIPVEVAPGKARPVNNGNADNYSTPPEMKLEEGLDYYAEVITSKGRITIDLFEEMAPNNVNNIIFLANEEFYNGSSFHRIMKDYIIQGGDPLGTGNGGPGYYIDDEINAEFEVTPFTVLMANADRDLNGSQFFITTRNITEKNIEQYIQGRYTVIGEVTNGFNVVDNIELGRVDSERMPIEPVIIEEMIIRSVQ